MQTTLLTVPITRINLPAGTFVLTRPPSGAHGDSNGDLNLTSALAPATCADHRAGPGCRSSMPTRSTGYCYRLHNRSVGARTLTVTLGGCAQRSGRGILNTARGNWMAALWKAIAPYLCGGIYNLVPCIFCAANPRKSGLSGVGLTANGPTTIGTARSTTMAPVTVLPRQRRCRFVSGAHICVSAGRQQHLQPELCESGWRRDRSINALYLHSPIFGNDADHNRDEKLLRRGGGRWSQLTFCCGQYLDRQQHDRQRAIPTTAWRP